MIDFTVSTSDLIAALALVVSGYAIWITRNFNKRQLGLIESQEKLNQRLLQQGETEDVEARKADVGASLVQIGRTQHKLRIFNKGKAIARNVRIEFPDGNDLVVDSDIPAKFPLESLEPQGSVNLITAVCDSTPLKHKLILYWTDGHNEANEKQVNLIVS